MSPLVTVITPSFNKKEYVFDAITSVMNQTFKDFEYLIIENSTDPDTKKAVHDFIDKAMSVSNVAAPVVKVVDVDFTPEQRKEFYPTARILNTFYPFSKGQYFFYLSDDDILMPECLEKMVDAMQRQNAAVVYHTQLTQKESDGVFNQTSQIEANRVISPPSSVDCLLDGGQIMFDRSCLDDMEKPYYSETYPDASHCDGLFFSRLAQKYVFYPLNIPLSIHRVTEKSTWTTL